MINLKNAVSSIVSAPTLKDGGYKANNWLTALKNNTPSFEGEIPETISISDTDVSLAAVIVSALEPIYSSTNSVTLEDMLRVWSSGTASTLQYSVKQAGQKQATIENAQLVSADSWFRNSVFVNASNRDNTNTISEAILEFLQSKNEAEKKKNKDVLVSIVLDKLMPSDTFNEYTRILERQTEESKRFQSLIDLGFRNISRISDNVVRGVLDFSQVAEVAPKVESVGWKAIASVPNMSNLTVSYSLQLVETNEENTKPNASSDAPSN